MHYGFENVTIQNAEPRDASALRQLAIDANIDAWTEADYSDEISRPNSFVIKAATNDKLAGFLVARIVPGTTEFPDAEIYNVAVAPLNRRCGIGTSLLVALLDRLMKRNVRDVWLEVRESNSDAIAFYERHAFISEVTRPHFYANPTENAVIMRRPMELEMDVSYG